MAINDPVPPTQSDQNLPGDIPPGNRWGTGCGLWTIIFIIIVILAIWWGWGWRGGYRSRRGTANPAPITAPPTGTISRAVPPPASTSPTTEITTQPAR